MQPTDWKFAGTLFAALATALLAGAAEPVKLNIKLGLWEIASESQINGAPPLSDERLSRLTPEQRARVEAALQSTMAEAAKPKLSKHCLTPEKIARGLDVDQHDARKCERKIVTNSGSELEFTDKCAEDNGSTLLDEHFQLSGSESVSGSVHMERTNDGKTMSINRTIHGKWLGASCGDIKDIQIEK